MYREKLKFIDLFCGIGGFRIAFEEACEENNIQPECVFSSDIDKYAQESYEANFGETPYGDITKIDENDIPDHDILFAGFPCQPFSIIGQMKGLNDTRGTLFFDIARIIEAKRPKAFILENVKQLVGHDKGKTLKVIVQTLKDLGYHVQYSIRRNCFGFWPATKARKSCNNWTSRAYHVHISRPRKTLYILERNIRN